MIIAVFAQTILSSVALVCDDCKCSIDYFTVLSIGIAQIPINPGSCAVRTIVGRQM